ncbi:MAG: redox-regulated ATPase YchF [Candidatus Pacearchaeota archaeon]
MLIGLVGKPSVGKSTFFKAATLADVPIASYPFTTIKSNHGVGYVRVECIDREFGVQCNPSHGFCIKGERFVPVELMDVAGLVSGASEGKGLGNQFLDDLREADVFIHVVDISGMTDSEGKALDGSGSDHDPSKDVEFLDVELDNWFYGILMKAWKGFSKRIATEAPDANSFSKAVVKQFSGLKVSEEHVKSVLRNGNLPEKPGLWKEDDLRKFAAALREESKPTIIAANKIDAGKGKDNYEKLKEKFPKRIIIPCSADSELALREASKAELIDYVPGENSFEIKGELSDKQKGALDKINENVLEVFGSTGVQDVLNKSVFELLDYVAIFPASANKLGDSKGNILPDCFLLPPGSTALDFAYFLHTDFGKNFIKAIDARSKKALGKEYVLKHRDALEIVTR